MEVVWIDPQTGKRWIRKGKCIHCAHCCSTLCPHLYFVALRDIKKGEKFYGIGTTSGNLIALCDVFDKDVTVNMGNCVRGCSLRVRKSFPSSPLETPTGCGYYWVDEEGNRWKKPDYRKGVV